MKEWYRTGTVMNTATSEMGEFLVSVMFDNGDLRLVPLSQLRLVKRPRFCQVKHVIQDIDECNQEFKGNCSHRCVNSPGSYYCKCPNGFQMSQDNKTCKCPKGSQESKNRTVCLNIDECNENVKNNCSHLCINSAGRYYCNCPNGF
ncbi:unnamed protein product [Porites evermanni]|uniref:EGF-like domain-containing protein n=1 Tax=Porites evermanni TaxID=104178 RepID=A0ABN8PHY5_9CNID|nr:unnamed protein product [Porites evermanni]